MTRGFALAHKFAAVHGSRATFNIDGSAAILTSLVTWSRSAQPRRSCARVFSFSLEEPPRGNPQRVEMYSGCRLREGFRHGTQHHVSLIRCNVAIVSK